MQNFTILLNNEMDNIKLPIPLQLR